MFVTLRVKTQKQSMQIDKFSASGCTQRQFMQTSAFSLAVNTPFAACRWQNTSLRFDVTIRKSAFSNNRVTIWRGTWYTSDTFCYRRIYTETNYTDRLPNTMVKFSRLKFRREAANGIFCWFDIVAHKPEIYRNTGTEVKSDCRVSKKLAIWLIRILALKYEL